MSTAPQQLNELTGIRLPKDACVVIVKTEWNNRITDELTRGALEILEAANCRVKIFTVPGAVEIGHTIQYFDKCHSKSSQKADAYLAFGCVIKGETPHFEYVCDTVTRNIADLNLQLDAPVIFGVLTVFNEAQAWDRLGGAHGHKGKEAAVTAMKMLALKREIRKLK